MRRTTSIFLLLALVVGVLGCRKTWNTRLGIPPTVYEQNAYSVFVDDERQHSFLVTPRAADVERFVVLDGAVYVTERADDRAYRLRGVTPGASPAPGAPKSEPVFTAQLSDAITKLGKHGYTTDDGVEWVGKPPAGAATVVAVDPARIASGQADIVSSVGTWDQSATWFDLAPDPGHLVVVEGAALSARPVVARLGREAAVIEPAWAVLAKGPLPPDDRHLYPAKVSPIARSIGANYYTTIWNDRVYIGSTELIQSDGVPYLLGENPLGVGGTATDVAFELRGLEAMKRGKPLAAVGFFDADDLDIHDREETAWLGLLELLAEAGYYDYVRQILLERGPATGVRRAIDARFKLRAGRKGARDAAALAYEELLRRDTALVAQARGAIALLVARIDANNGNWKTATAVAEQAADNFKESGDALRAAEAELFAGEAAVMAGDAQKADTMANQARSRFYHGNSPYLSALAEISLAYVYERLGKSDDAKTMADYARRRFVASGDEVAANRATIAMAKLGGDGAGLAKGFDEALARGDALGAFDAAIATMRTSGLPEGDERVAIAGALAQGFPHLVEPLRRVAGAAAAKEICASRDEWLVAMKSADAELASGMCGARMNLAATVRAPSVSADAVYRKLIAGEFATVTQMVGEIEVGEKTSFKTIATLAMARNLAAGDTAQDAHATAMAAAKRLDPESRWSSLAEMAERAERVGAHELASLWGADAVEAVKTAELADPVAVRAELARQHVARLVRMGRPLDAGNAAERALTGMVAEKPGVRRAAATLAGYGAVAASIVGATNDVESLRTSMKSYLEGLPPFELAEATSALAWYAAHNGVESLARDDVEAAKSAMKMLTADERSATMVARNAVAEAFLARRKGSDTAAFKGASVWFDNPGDEPEVALDLWETVLQTAPNDGLRASFMKRLDSAELADAARGAIVREHLGRGRFAEAQTALGGAEAGATPTDKLVLGLRVRAMSGEPPARHVVRLAQTTELFELDMLSATVFSGVPRETASAWAADVKQRRGVSDLQRERAALIGELAAAKPAKPKLTNKLQAELERTLETRDAAKIVSAVANRVEDLVSTGRPDAALTVLDRNAAWFSQTTPESVAEYERLRAAATLAQLDLVEAAKRMAATTIDEEGGPGQAGFYANAARAFFALGMIPAGRDALRLAKQRARIPGDRALISSVEALAARFDVTLD